MQDMVMLQPQSRFLISDLLIAISQRKTSCTSLRRLSDGQAKQKHSLSTPASHLKADKWIIEARKIKWFRVINRVSWLVCASDKLKRLSPILTAFRVSKTEPNIKE